MPRKETPGRCVCSETFEGWSAGVLTSIPEQWLARITEFVCGGVMMNTLVVELPEGRRGRFWPFVLAAAGYSLVLIVVLGELEVERQAFARKGPCVPKSLPSALSILTVTGTASFS